MNESPPEPCPDCSWWAAWVCEECAKAWRRWDLAQALQVPIEDVAVLGED